MKAALLQEFNGRVEIVDDVEVATPIGREVLVEVRAVGLCHSDLHCAENDFGRPLPAVLGHEFSGVVKEVGPAVTEFSVGDRVVGSLLQHCANCSACVAGRSFQCTNRAIASRTPDQGFRLSRHGESVYTYFNCAAFAEFSLVHESQLARIPEEMPFPQAALLGCGTITGAGAAINTAEVRPGDSVAVIGVGGVGLNVLSGARIAGASRLIAVDVQASKLELARKFGATNIVNASETDPVKAVRELVEGGVDHSFEVVGTGPTTVQAIEIARNGGAAYLVGVHKPGTSINFNAHTNLISPQKRLQGVYMGSSNIKHDIPMYADLYLQGQLNLDDLISCEINLSQLNDAFDDLRKGSIARAVVTSF